jgi:hypothetical protein
VVCFVLGALPLVLDAFGALGGNWPRGSLPAGISRASLALLPWLLLMGLPRRSSDGLRALDGALGLPLFGLAIACDVQAGVPWSALVSGGVAAVSMVFLLGWGARVAARPLYAALWFLLVLGPVGVGLALGFANAGAPLSPEGAHAFLKWSPVGWCLMWAAENPGLEPRLPATPFAALLTTGLLALVPYFGRAASTGSEEES